MFITFEGPEGAGKTTAVTAIAKRIQDRGDSVLVTREPGSGELGAQIRHLLLHGGDMPSETELFLFLADRSNHVANVIRPALDSGKIVLCDRYTDSTFVYQSLVRGLDAGFVRSANTFATGGLQPDKTFLFDLAPEIGLSRITSKDRLDNAPLEFHRKVREGFLLLAKEDPERWKVLDATERPEQLVEHFFDWFEATRQERITRSV